MKVRFCVKKLLLAVPKRFDSVVQKNGDIVVWTPGMALLATPISFVMLRWKMTFLFTPNVSTLSDRSNSSLYTVEDILV